MKKTIILLLLITTAFSCGAQRFFFLESSNPVMENILHKSLLGGYQFVARTPLASDYIIKTNVDYESGYGIINLKMSVQDSITSKTVFEANEEFRFGDIHANSGIYVNMIIKSFIDRNINQIINGVQGDYLNGRMNLLKPGKDKT
jgi:hypothetical protein